MCIMSSSYIYIAELLVFAELLIIKAESNRDGNDNKCIGILSRPRSRGEPRERSKFK
jgi:hypothetical protein